MNDISDNDNDISDNNNDISDNDNDISDDDNDISDNDNDISDNANDISDNDNDPMGRGTWGACALSPLGFLFHRNEVYEQKFSIKRVRDLSQNTGNVHFRD